MCIIMFQPASSEQDIPFNYFKAAQEKNNDGHGLMYVRNNVLVVKTQMGNIDKFYEKYLAARGLNTPIGIHFRIGTSGARNLSNCHPFYLNPTTAFMHNGVIGRGANGKSDTRIFAENLLRQLPENWMNNSAICQLLADHIDSNKMVFLNNKKQSVILNESLGHWTDKVWYSNSSYRTYPIVDHRSSKTWEYDNDTKTWERKAELLPFGSACDTNLPSIKKDSDPDEWSTPLSFAGRTWCWSCLPDYAWHQKNEDKLFDIMGTDMVFCSECSLPMNPLTPGMYT